MEKLFIIGASGLVGKALTTAAADYFDVYGTYFSNATNLLEEKAFQLDITDDNQLNTLLQLIHPDIVISTLHGDFEEQYAFHEKLAKAVQNRSTRVVFLSTTNVFDGDLTKHHLEIDDPISKSDYGNYKIRCEQMLKQVLGENVTIIRIPGIWGTHSPRFNALIEQIKNGEQIKAYNNLLCSFLSDEQLAKQLVIVLQNKLQGTIHLTSKNQVREADFYEQLLQQLALSHTKVERTYYGEAAKTYYFGLQTMREEVPEKLQVTTDQVVEFLVNKHLKRV